MGSNRIYLDNAATTWPKPETVYQAVDHAQRSLGVSLGRGSYRQVGDVSRIIRQSRSQIAAKINADNARQVIFTFSCTDSLSMAILGWLNPGDHVVTSLAEHNSVLRPLAYLQRQGNVSVERVRFDEQGRVCPQAIIDAIRPQTRLVVLSHASNVTGTIQDLETIGQFCQQHQVPFLVDAAQTMGILPIDVKAIGCDMLAAAGHKGLLGPTGTGILYLSPKIADQLRPLRFGGTGGTGGSGDSGNSEALDRQPETIPEKFESGNMNVPGLIGLAAGLDFLQTDQAAELRKQSNDRQSRLWQGLQEIPGLHLYGANTEQDRMGVFSIRFDQLSCHDAAVILDTQWSIQARAGLHCAPLMHQGLGTLNHGGTLRISPGLFTTNQDIEMALQAISKIAAVDAL